MVRLDATTYHAGIVSALRLRLHLPSLGWHVGMVARGSLLQLDTVPRVPFRDEIDVIIEEFLPLTRAVAGGHQRAAAAGDDIATGCVDHPSGLITPWILLAPTWRFLILDHIGQMLRFRRVAVP